MHSGTPYSLDMDPQLAQQLAAQGASLLVLDLPQGSLLGVNQHTFATGPKFKGVKMLPPGTHFISYRAVSLESGASPVTGFFLHLQPRQVVVRRWDPATETLVTLPDEEEEQRYAAGVRRYDFDQGMAPYNLTAHAAWSQISDCITPGLIQQVSPVSGDLSIIAEGAEAELIQPRTQAERRLLDQLKEGRARRQQHEQQQEQQQQQEEQQQQQEEQQQSGPQQQGPGVAGPGVQADVTMQGPGELLAREQTQEHTAQHAEGGGRSHPDQSGAQPGDAGTQPGGAGVQSAPSRGGRCRYTQLPRVVKHAGATPAELTALNMDKSTLLQEVVSQHYGGQMDLLLGELQFAFIAFVYGQTLGGYAQWKALLLLLLGCEAAPLHTSSSSHYVKMLHMLRHQLEISIGAPQGGGAGGGGATPFGESLVEELLPDSFLRHMLGSFFTMLQENDREVGPELAAAATELKQLLRARLGWEYSVQVLPEGSDDEEGPTVVEDPEDWVRL